MAAVSRGIIDETSNAVPLNGFFWGNILFLLFVFRKCIFTCVFICFFVNLHFLSYYFSALNIIQGFSLNQRGLCLNRLERTLGRVVDKLSNGSRVNSHGQFIFGKQSLSLFRSRGNTAFQQSRRCNFSHFQDKVKTGLFFTFFRKSVLLTMKIAT